MNFLFHADPDPAFHSELRIRIRNHDHNNNACVVRREDTGTCLGEYWKLLAEEVDLVQQQVNRGAL